MSIPDKEKPPIDLYRANRQFERMMMGVDPYYRSDAPREDRATLSELQEIRSRQSLPLDQEDFGPVVAEMTMTKHPNGSFTVTPWRRVVSEDK